MSLGSKQKSRANNWWSSANQGCSWLNSVKNHLSDRSDRAATQGVLRTGAKIGEQFRKV
jgi:hypothetical protein